MNTWLAEEGMRQLLTYVAKKKIPKLLNLKMTAKMDKTRGGGRKPIT